MHKNDDKYEKYSLEPEMRLLFMFIAGYVSVISGNSLGWNVLHSLLGWWYVAYKLAQAIFGG